MRQDPGPPTRGQDPPQRGKGPSPTPPPPAPPRRIWLFFVLIVLANILLTRMFFPGSKPVKVPYTLFKQEVIRGNVDKIYSRGESMTGRFRHAVLYPAKPDSATGAQPRSAIDFSTTLPAFVDPGLESLLIAHGVEISAEPIGQGNPWLGLLFSFAPALLLIGLYVWAFRRAAKQGVGGGLMGIGRSTARRFDSETADKVTFEDVAGIDEAENELVEIVDFL
ncbi:MAG TPA: ATP-dependent metallopeptidase FtsH/Yme1/Tma family protein, partial [Candidatus Eisenbacteria bacterium]|nr:ATP-dependent metallopeptidase FtsH/Yme1/Tma family protein [Candidatus Eisenbacteria bacterium]